MRVSDDYGSGMQDSSVHDESDERGARYEHDTERTRVGHCKRDETDVYVGRGSDGRNLNTAKIGARGWLGNPHSLEDGYTRDESLMLFREDFEAKLRGDDEFREAVADLSGKTLGCWCQSVDEDGPACHGEIIAEWADRLARSVDPGTERYPRTDIHLCKRCRDELGAGDEVVCLSDGFVEPDESYNVENRRFFHLDCWLAHRDLDTDTEGSDR